MPIDISKIKPGDRVRCEFEVADLLGKPVIVLLPSPGRLTVDLHEIIGPAQWAEHIPQPYVPKVGELVVHVVDKVQRFKVIAIHEGMIWVRSLGGEDEFWDLCDVREP